MPTEKIYKKAIEISRELIKLGLNGWETEMTITDKKKKIKTDVKIVVKLKTKKLKKRKEEICECGHKKWEEHKITFKPLTAQECNVKGCRCRKFVKRKQRKSK